MALPRAASAATIKAVKGGATTISQCFDSATSGRNASKNARASACVLYIFQLPAMTGRRNYVRPSLSASTPGNFSPARNSSEAPPPVEMWEI